LQTPALELGEYDKGSAWFRESASLVNRASVAHFGGTNHITHKPFPIPQYQPGITLFVYSAAPISEFGTPPFLVFDASSKEIETMGGPVASTQSTDAQLAVRTRRVSAAAQCTTWDVFILAFPAEQMPDVGTGSATQQTREFIIAEVTEIVD
jgi:hypothetical protein